MTIQELIGRDFARIPEIRARSVKAVTADRE